MLKYDLKNINKIGEDNKMKKRVIRIIIYEGEKEWVDRTLSKSLSVGTNTIYNDNKIIVLEKSLEDRDINLILKKGYIEYFSDVDGK